LEYNFRNHQPRLSRSRCAALIMHEVISWPWGDSYVERAISADVVGAYVRLFEWITHGLLIVVRAAADVLMAVNGRRENCPLSRPCICSLASFWNDSKQWILLEMLAI